jgi:Holliday junction resolvase RusA-like endonuclease
MTTDTVTITVPGEAVGKGAPRFVRQTGRAYTPAKTQAWLARVQQAALLVAPETPWSGPVAVEIWVVRPFLASMSKAKREAAERGEILPSTKPDCSNYAKGIEDALSGVIFDDDAQITDLTVAKRFGPRPETRVVVRRVS